MWLFIRGGGIAPHDQIINADAAYGFAMEEDGDGFAAFAHAGEEKWEVFGAKDAERCESVIRQLYAAIMNHVENVYDGVVVEPDGRVYTGKLERKGWKRE